MSSTRSIRRGTWLWLPLALVVSANAAGAVKFFSSTTSVEDTVYLIKPIKARSFPDLTVSWVFAPEFKDAAKGLEPAVLFCDVQLFRKDEFVNGVDVVFQIDLIEGSEVILSYRLMEKTTSFAQASFQLNREDLADEISHVQVTSTLKGKLRVDEVSLECTSRSKQ